MTEIASSNTPKILKKCAYSKSKIIFTINYVNSNSIK